MIVDVDGRTAYAYTGGRAFDPSLPCIAFLHGAQHDHSVWGLQARWFAHHGYAVLAFDLPGHGRSQGPAHASVDALADWTARALAGFDVASAALVGHSLGSLVALECAARHPARVARIALVATAAPMKVSDALLASTREEEDAAMDMINAWSHFGLAPKPAAPGPGFWLRGMNRKLMARQPPGVLHNDFAACNAYAGGPAAAARIAMPTLVVLGARDAMTPPRAGRALADAIRGARTVVIPDAGHSIPTEAPDALLDALRAWAS